MPRQYPRRAPLIIAGDINLDLLALTPSFSGLGGDNLAPALRLRCGGGGLNTALALARWRAPVRLLGAVGKDWFGDYLLSRARRRGVDVSRVQRVQSALTGLMMVVVTPDRQRTFFGSRGANARFAWQPDFSRALQGAAWLHLLGFCFLSPTAARAAEKLLAEARRRGIPVSLDVGMGPARLARRAILRRARQADILLLSRDEATALTGKQNPRAALRALERAGIRRVVIKLGRAGCLYREGARLQRAPAFAVPGVDTTGCGDAFTAAFLASLTKGWPLKDAALTGNAAGAAAAAVVGAGENLPGRAEVRRVLKAQRLSGRWDSARRRLLARLRKV